MEQTQVQPIGALIDPDGREGHPLDKEEYDYLKAALELIRSNKHSVALHVVAGVLGDWKMGKLSDLSKVLFFIETEVNEMDLASRRSEVRGLLNPSVGDPEPLFKDEGDDLLNFLTTLRRGGWLADFMRRLAASGADKFPDEITPIMAMTSLAMDLAEFEQKTNAARELFAKFPKTMKAMLPPEPVIEPAVDVPEPRKPKAARKGKN